MAEETQNLNSFGAGFIVLILFAFFVDIIEIIATASVVGVWIAWILGIIVDTLIFIAVGVSKNIRKQWKKFLISYIGENVTWIPILVWLEFLPIRTIILIWMYFGQKPDMPPEQTEQNEEL